MTILVGRSKRNSISMDMNAFTVALSVNLGITNRNQLEFVQNINTVLIGLVLYEINIYTHPRFERMSAIFCAHAVYTATASNDTICAVNFYNYPAYPVLFHYEKKCISCDTVNSYTNDEYILPSNEIQVKSICDTIDIVPTLIYRQSASPELIIDLHKAYKSNYTVLEELISNATINGDNKFFDICKGCRILFSNVWDNEQTISPYSYILKNGTIIYNLKIILFA